MRFKTFYLNEDIIQGGRLVTFYHRTGRDEDLTDIDKLFKDKSSIINSIKNSGLKAGSGAKYGKGVYGTYELESQLNSRMVGSYGKIIVKMKTVLDDILIFDYKTAKKVYGKKYTLLDQLNKFGITIKKENLIGITDMSKELKNKTVHQSNYVTEIMYNFKDIYSKLKGIMYHGKLDGDTIVIYNDKVIVPMSMNTTLKNSNKLDQPTWIDIKNKDLIKKTLDIQDLIMSDIEKAKYDKLVKALGGDKKAELQVKFIIDEYQEFLDTFINSKNLVLDIKQNISVKSGYLECTTFSYDKIYGNSKVKCDTWEDGTVFDKAEVKCDTWKLGSVKDNAKVKCDTWELGFVRDKAEVKCDTWKEGNVYDNAKIECKTWEDGVVKGNAKVECETWKDGVVYENAQVYIKGKLAKIENNQVVL